MGARRHFTTGNSLSSLSYSARVCQAMSEASWRRK
jgi:hypothetical protein